ncbi:MAG TPA: NHL repeat-containing protein [Candidatus Hydrogenedentes bacterium]|nr:NHL repeat-containing protein [Candidatus Hydrogenedentota bacterium]HQH51869.1 NHL repeat-containing protein [Candidatus Hydrogenedentota bacterium]
MQTRRLFTCCVVVLALLLVANAAWGQTLPKNRRATIGPPIVYLEPGGERQFKVVMIATRLMAAAVPKEVKWAVNDIPGGNELLGTINADGLYRAPAKAPSPCEIHVCAEVPEAANRFLWSTVVVGDAPPAYKRCGYWSEPVQEGKGRTEHLVDPHGVGLDADGNILVADQLGSQVVRFTPEGAFLGPIGSGKGSEPGQFTEPRIVTTDAQGRIFVSDSKGDRPRIQVFDREGKFLQIFAEKGMKPGMILRAHGMGFDPAGRLFATDVDNMRVSVFDSNGGYLYDWGKEGLNPGEFNSPHGLHVDKNSDVLVTGYYGPTQKFNSEGDFLLAFCHGDPPDGPVYFHNMTGDQWGDVYISVRSKGGYQGAIQRDGKHISFVKYNNNGSYVTGWSLSNPEHGETSAVVDAHGRFYALFKGEKEMGVEIFQEE